MKYVLLDEGITSREKNKLFLNINGVRQGMFLKGADIHNPVLLYLHGGPGSPEIAFDSDTPSALDQMFMVCWWEQRGAGISYSKKIPAESMCINQLVDDAIAVADYLRFSSYTILGNHRAREYFN